MFKTHLVILFVCLQDALNETDINLIAEDNNSTTWALPISIQTGRFNSTRPRGIDLYFHMYLQCFKLILIVYRLSSGSRVVSLPTGTATRATHRRFHPIRHCVRLYERNEHEHFNPSARTRPAGKEAYITNETLSYDVIIML